MNRQFRTGLGLFGLGLMVAACAGQPDSKACPSNAVSTFVGTAPDKPSTTSSSSGGSSTPLKKFLFECFPHAVEPGHDQADPDAIKRAHASIFIPADSPEEAIQATQKIWDDAVAKGGTEILPEGYTYAGMTCHNVVTLGSCDPRSYLGAPDSTSASSTGGGGDKGPQYFEDWKTPGGWSSVDLTDEEKAQLEEQGVSLGNEGNGGAGGSQ
jgi:hypothetical protein